MRLLSWFPSPGALVALGLSMTLACSSNSDGSDEGDSTGGSAGTGGGSSSGSTTGSGGRAGSGGATASGGRIGSGGAPGTTGGSASTGGTPGATGGSASTGGAPSTGGTQPTGGASGTGGGASTGGVSGTGGGASTGGGGNTPACPGAKPDQTNTGVPPGVSLTAVSGDVIVSEDGTTIDAKDIAGFLVIEASHVRVTRSIVRGGVATSNGAGIRVRSGTDIVIEDTEVALAHPSAFLDGVSGSNLTVRRANIHGGVDGMKLGSNSAVECSYIHDMASFASDPNQGGGATHNDAIQILSGTSIRVVGNRLIAAKSQNAAIQVTQDFGVVTDLRIESNWADGGGCTFNFSHKGRASLTGVSATGNRFGKNSSFGCPILKSTKTTLTSAGNVYEADGTPVPIQTHD